MVHYAVRCDIVPGRSEDLDRLLSENAKEFWLKQPGVRGFQVYEDALTGWPERTIMIEVDNLESLQRILDSEERKRLRREFNNYATNVQSQILEQMI
ncbi:MAG TPA: hypothetical protein VFA32_25260 [Dehalococcoidia bacterium]|jgi:quinol monooxygenase YgiN|nr:hypothetical protein [Dehalococcoidia bacterium]